MKYRLYGGGRCLTSFFSIDNTTRCIGALFEPIFSVYFLYVFSVAMDFHFWENVDGNAGLGCGLVISNTNKRII